MEIKYNNLSNKVKQVLNDIVKIAYKDNISIYLIGGIVRDLILNKPSKDIDIVVEGDAIKLVTNICESLKVEAEYFDKFKTAKIIFDDIDVDFVTARSEVYKYNGALPDIEFSNIKNDQFRRDFSINTVAVKLEKNCFGEIVDNFNGLIDIQNKVIRVLHKNSFKDDPTRILRGIRFKERFDFTIGDETLKFIEEAIELNIFNCISKDRIDREFKKFFNEGNPVKCLIEILNLGIIDKIYPTLNLTQKVFSDFNLVRNSFSRVNEYKEIIKSDFKIELVYLMILVFNLNIQDAKDFITEFNMNKKEKNKINIFIEFNSNQDNFSNLNNVNILNYNLYKLLSGLSNEALIIFDVLNSNSLISENIKKYLFKLRDTKLYISGKDIVSLGISKGPRVKIILDKVLEYKLNYKELKKEEELNYASKFIAGKL